MPGSPRPRAAGSRSRAGRPCMPSRSIGGRGGRAYQASIFACSSSRFSSSARLRGARSRRMASSALQKRSGSIPVPGSASFSMNSRSSAATCNAPIWFQSLITPSFCKSFILAVSGHAGEAACGFAARQRERQKMQPVWLFPVDRLMKTSCPSCDTYAPGAGERFHLITAAAVAELRVARLLCCHD